MNRRIQLFPLGRSTTTGVTSVSLTETNYQIYVDGDSQDFPTIYMIINADNRLEKRAKGVTHGLQIKTRCFGCKEVWLEGNKSVYMSEHDRHCVLKWSSITNSTRRVAGESGLI